MPEINVPPEILADPPTAFNESSVPLLMVRMPLDVTFPRSFDAWFRAIVKPLAVKVDAVVTMAAAVCEIAPPALTVRLSAEIAPRIIATVSAMVTFAPLAATVPKLFVLFARFTLPTATKLAVPATVSLPAPDSAIWPLVTSVRFPKVMALVIAILPEVLLPMVSLLAVILPIFPLLRPSVVEFPAPPRSTPAPSV